jgi:hypothetical protein
MLLIHNDIWIDDVCFVLKHNVKKSNYKHDGLGYGYGV